MVPVKKRIPRNMARIEFLACRETIEILLSLGFDKKKIHARLTENGEITMSYDALCKIMAKAARNELKVQSIGAPPAPPTPQKASAPRPAHPNIIKAKPDGLQDPRTVDPSTVI